MSNTSVGTASANVELNLPCKNANNYTIAVGVSGAYCNDPYHPAEEEIITVSKPLPGGFIVGGGALINTYSSGRIKGATGLETGFSFDVKFDNYLSNPMGKAYIKVASYYRTDGTLDNVMHTYLINSNSVSRWSVGTPTRKQASFTSIANLAEQFADGTIVNIEGGNDLQITMTDGGNDGKYDKIAITLQRKSGGIWFTSNLAGSKTIEQLLTSGNVYVSTASYSQCNHIDTKSSEIIIPATQSEVGGLNVYPNPFTDRVYFEMKLAKDSKVTIGIYNLNGLKLATVFSDDVQALQYYRLEYVPGNVPTGALIYKLLVDGRVLFTGKIIHKK